MSISVSVSSSGVLAARASLSQSVQAVFLLREHLCGVSLLRLYFAVFCAVCILGLYFAVIHHKP